MEKIIKTISLTVKTGLHIGAGNDQVQIGGVDSAVIKDPISKLPYIPGSSLKGKIRCLLETEGGYGEKNDMVNLCFGASNPYIKDKGEDFEQTPTRFIFRDLVLCEEDKKRFDEGEIETEFKTEIVIDRTRGNAKEGGLRTIERVPPTVNFQGEVLIRFLNEDEKEKILKLLNEGIDLLNKDYLGGSGSRGYGAVNIKIE